MYAIRSYYVQVLASNTESVDETWEPVLKRYDLIQNNYNQLKIELMEENFPKRKLNLVFRAYNDGIAFRTEFPKQFGDMQFVITDELSQFNFTADHTCWAVNYGSYTTSQEKTFFQRQISEISTEMVIGLPMTIKISDQCYAAITEAALVDYAGMYLKTDSKSGSLVRNNFV